MTKFPWIKYPFRVAVYILLFCRPQFPQVSDISFDHIFLEQGLSQSIVKCILQDQRGFMYFGTEDGLNIYNAYSFSILRRTGEENSLSYNDITSICQDKSGRFWIGTFNSGVNLYIPDKDKFIHFNYSRNNINCLTNDNINAIVVDEKRNVWIGTDYGLNKIRSTKSDSVFIIERGIKNTDNLLLLSDYRILSLFIDSNENLWAGTDQGLFKISGIPGKDFYQVEKFVNRQTDTKSLTNNIVRAIFEDSRRYLWIGTDYGLNRLSLSGPSVFKNFIHNSNDKYSISHNEIYAICEDASGLLWIGTNGGGINIYDSRTERFTSYLHDPLDSRSLSTNEIRSLYRDRSNIMWVGTYGGGINKVSRGTDQFYHYKQRQNDVNSLSHPIIWSFYEDKDSVLWIGTHQGLDRLDRKNNTYKHFRNSAAATSISNNIVRIITPAGDGKLLIGTNGGGVNEFDPLTGIFRRWVNIPSDTSSLIFNEIRSIYLDKEGNIWVGTYGRGMDKFDRRTGVFTHHYNIPDDPTSLSHNYVRTIVEDSKGYLWIGTEGGGLNRFDKKTGIFKRFRSQNNKPNALSSDYIFSIFIDSSGILWLGTYGGGLNKFNPESGVEGIWTVNDGLPSNSIYGILNDDQGFLWLSTNNGLSRFNPVKEEFKNFNARDGLQNNEFNGGSYYKTSSGEMLFGGINGFNAFYPWKIRDNNYIPPVVLTSFKVFNREVSFDLPLCDIKEIELDYSDNVFSFEFSALDYSSPDKNRYAYKLEGVDRDWVYINSDQRLAAYTTLSPGTYTFNVKASNSDGIWNNEGVKVVLTIIPPFWQETWFVLLAFFFIAGIIFLLYLRRLRIIRMKVELKSAHDAQLSIMPQTDPVHEKFEVSGICLPANEVGGDFFDYFWLDNEHKQFGILVGDVSGKAMKAAVTAIMTSGMIMSEIRSNKCINKILDNVNETLTKKIEKKMFVSLCLCVIDTGEGILYVANAGLNRPVLVSGDKYEQLFSDGPRLPLGVKEDTRYQQRSFKLQKGDLLILTTDGVTEAQNSSRILFGDERLRNHIMSLNRNTLSVREIKESITKIVQTFVNKEKPYDDMTVLVLRMK